MQAQQKELNEKTKQIAELKSKASLGKCKKLEEEVSELRGKVQEYGTSHLILQAAEKARKEIIKSPEKGVANDPTTSEEAEVAKKQMILATVTATLSAWNSCPSYVKQHIDKQDKKIKELEEKFDDDFNRI